MTRLQLSFTYFGLAMLCALVAASGHPRFLLFVGYCYVSSCAAYYTQHKGPKELLQAARTAESFSTYEAHSWAESSELAASALPVSAVGAFPNIQLPQLGFQPSWESVLLHGLLAFFVQGGPPQKRRRK